MNENKKAAFSVATTESGSGNEITIDNANYTKKTAKKQGIVEQFLLKGSENAIPGAELMKLVGCCSIRYLQKMISIERQNGSLILASSEGYFLPADGEKGREEIQRFYAQFRSMALSTLKILKTARQALAIPEGQMEIDTWQNDLE